MLAGKRLVALTVGLGILVSRGKEYSESGMIGGISLKPRFLLLRRFPFSAKSSRQRMPMAASARCGEDRVVVKNAEFIC
jgi:hypothetical protein